MYIHHPHAGHTPNCQPFPPQQIPRYFAEEPAQFAEGRHPLRPPFTRQWRPSYSSARQCHVRQLAILQAESRPLGSRTLG